MPCSYEKVTRFVKPEGDHRVPFHAFCAICTVEVKACEICYSRRQSLRGWCVECYNSWGAGDFVPKPAEQPRILCDECDLMEKCAEMYGSWNETPRNEIIGYSYKPVCLCCPLSPSNYKRMPLVTPIVGNLPPTPLWKRKVDAGRAFREEMEFSKNSAEALIVYASFFSTQLSGTAALDHSKQKHEEKLSLREILRGQEFPSNRQFLRAIEKRQAKERAKNEV
jgi:hypothetical protein